METRRFTRLSRNLYGFMALKAAPSRGQPTPYTRKQKETSTIHIVDVAAGRSNRPPRRVFSLALWLQDDGNREIIDDQAIPFQQNQSGGDGGTPGGFATEIPKKRFRYLIGIYC
jgi:hypothetical protein